MNEFIGAFADDMAVAVKDLWISMPVLQRLFSEFAEISGLALNVKNTVIIRLWRLCNMDGLRRLIRESCPPWAHMTIADHGKYLGFMVGPGAREKNWSRVFSKKVEFWSGLKLGLALNVIAYNIYIVTVMLPCLSSLRSSAR
jgi:hypothetical protein